MEFGCHLILPLVGLTAYLAVEPSRPCRRLAGGPIGASPWIVRDYDEGAASAAPASDRSRHATTGPRTANETLAPTLGARLASPVRAVSRVDRSQFGRSLTTASWP